MSITTYNLTLDLQRSLHQVLVMKEGDHNSRKVIITFTENGQPFSLGDCSIDVRWRKPDQNIITPVCKKEDESSASFLCTEQMLLVPGIANVDAHIYNRDGLQLSTMPFQVSIKRSSVSNSELTSSSEFQSLTKLMEDFQKEHNNVKTEVNRLKTDAENASKKSQSYAVGNTNSRPGENTDNASYYSKLAQSHSKGGTNIRSGEASDNAKYYKEQAHASAQTSSTQAQAAASSAAAAAASQTTAAQKATQAGASAATASTKATESANSATLSQSYAIGGTDTRTGENTDNSKYYYQQSKSIYDNFSQAGTVTGVKGNAESAYRTGNVNITAANIGAVNKGGDTISGQLNFINSAEMRFVTPDVTGGHARGIEFADKNSTGMWGGIGAYGGAGMLHWIYIGAGTPYPWDSRNGLCISDTHIKWKNSSLVTESSGIAKEATKATQDGNGNNIVNTYAKKSESAAYRLVENGDFNSMTTPGLYTMKGSSTLNKPTNGGYHGLIVLRSDSGVYVQQIATKEGTTEVYVRYGSSSSWGAWERLLRGGDMVASATKATQDSNGNVIKDTYLPLSGGTITGNLRLKGSGNFGNILNFGDRDFVHISEPTDDHLEIKGSEINFVTPYTGNEKFTLNGKKIALAESIPNIQHGVRTVSLPANKATEFSISFEKSFSSIPNVVFTPRHNSATGTDMHKLKTITTSGFTGQIISSGGGTYAIEWIAIGS